MITMAQQLAQHPTQKECSRVVMILIPRSQRAFALSRKASTLPHTPSRRYINMMMPTF
jgi:hypothetical protein